VLIIPVDYTSEAIVRLSLQKQSLGKVFHLMNPQITPWASLIDYLRSFGYPVQGRPYIEWRRAIERSPKNALYPLLPTLAGEDDYEHDLAVQEIVKGRKTVFDCRNTTESLTGSGLVCPVADSSLIAKYLTHLIKTGVLEPPPTGKLRISVET
jgi:hypothetical protein